MAAESSHSAGCAANSAGVVDRHLDCRLPGRPHRCRRPRRGPGRLLHLREIRARHAGSSLGPWHQSLPAHVNRRTGGRLSRRRFRSPAQRRRADIRVPATTLQSAPAAVGAAGMDRPTSLQPRRGRRSVGPISRNTQLRRIHASGRGSLDHSNHARGHARPEPRFHPNPVPRPTPFSSIKSVAWSGRSSKWLAATPRWTTSPAPSRRPNRDPWGRRPPPPGSPWPPSNTTARSSTHKTVTRIVREIEGCRLPFSDHTRCRARGT